MNHAMGLGTFLAVKWRATFFKWPADIDPRKDLEGYRKLADGPMQEPLEGLRVVTVAPQDGNVQGQALGVSRYRQDDLGPIASVIPAVAVSGQVLRPLAFEIHAGQILSLIH